MWTFFREYCSVEVTNAQCSEKAWFEYQLSIRYPDVFHGIVRKRECSALNHAMTLSLHFVRIQYSQSTCHVQ
jgi:hypothetical protein